jgi:hypothetical protein
MLVEILLESSQDCFIAKKSKAVNLFPSGYFGAAQNKKSLLFAEFTDKAAMPGGVMVSDSDYIELFPD